MPLMTPERFYIKCVSPLIESEVAELPQYRDTGIIEQVVDTAELG